MHDFAQGVAAESRAVRKPVEPAAVRRLAEARIAAWRNGFGRVRLAAENPTCRSCISTKFWRQDVPK